MCPSGVAPARARRGHLPAPGSKRGEPHALHPAPRLGSARHCAAGAPAWSHPAGRSSRGRQASSGSRTGPPPRSARPAASGGGAARTHTARPRMRTSGAALVPGVGSSRKTPREQFVITQVPRRAGYRGGATKKLFVGRTKYWKHARPAYATVPQ
jgi:hypothetical protein